MIDFDEYKNVTGVAREILLREVELAETKNKPEFITNPKILLEFYDLENHREFDISAPAQLYADEYVEMLLRVVPNYLAQVSIHEIKIEAEGNIAFSSVLEKCIGTFAETGEKFDLVFRMSHGWVKLDGKWLLRHEHMSFPAGEDGKVVYKAEF